MDPAPSELREAIALNACKLATESSQAASVARQLAAVGHRASPKVLAGKMDGLAIRLYVWANSPAGDLILATGPRFEPRVFDASEIAEERPGIYILATPDQGKATERVERAVARYTPPRVRLPEDVKTRAKIAKAVAPIAEQTSAAAERAASRGREIPDARRKEVRELLAALLG